MNRHSLHLHVLGALRMRIRGQLVEDEFRERVRRLAWLHDVGYPRADVDDLPLHGRFGLLIGTADGSHGRLIEEVLGQQHRAADVGGQVLVPPLVDVAARDGLVGGGPAHGVADEYVDAAREVGRGGLEGCCYGGFLTDVESEWKNLDGWIDPFDVGHCVGDVGCVSRRDNDSAGAGPGEDGGESLAPEIMVSAEVRR